MFRKIDESPWLIRQLQTASSTLARRRGLPVVLGIALIIVSMVVELLNIALGSPLLGAIQIILHHIGLLIALIGLLMIQPLGD